MYFLLILTKILITIEQNDCHNYDGQRYIKWTVKMFQSLIPSFTERRNALCFWATSNFKDL